MKSYTITLTREHLQTVANALAEMPFKASAPVIAEINKQVVEQDKPPTISEAAE